MREVEAPWEAQVLKKQDSPEACGTQTELSSSH